MYQCKKCGKNVEFIYGSGQYCNRKCANSRTWTEEDKLKKSKAAKGNPKVLAALALAVDIYKKRLHLKGPGNRCNKEHLLKMQLGRKRKREELKRNTPFEQWSWIAIKRELYKEYGNKCQKCGYEFTDNKGKGPFDIHHKDGNHENNKKDNLEILCLICHWKTSNYRNKGRKHSKESRRKIREAAEKRRIKKANISMDREFDSYSI